MNIPLIKPQHLSHRLRKVSIIKAVSGSVEIEEKSDEKTTTETATTTENPEENEDFLDMRKLVKGSINALAQLPTGQKVNKTENFYNLLQIPAAILGDIAGGRVLETTTAQSHQVADDASPFRQMTSWEEEEKARLEEEKKREAIRMRLEVEKRLIDEARIRAEAQRRLAQQEGARIAAALAQALPKPSTTPLPIQIPQQIPQESPLVVGRPVVKSVERTPRIETTQMFNLPSLNLNNLFGTPMPTSPPILSPLAQGMPTPHYAYQPIVQPDGTTYYQQVLIVPSSIPFPAPNQAAHNQTSTTTTTTTITTAIRVEPKRKIDIHKENSEKRFKTYSSKTLQTDGATSAEKESMSEENGEDDEGHSFKLVSKGRSTLATASLPSNEEQQRVAQVFADEFSQKSVPSKSYHTRSMSPYFVKSSMMGLNEDKKLMKLKRRDPEMEQDDEMVKEKRKKGKKRRRSWRREIHRREEMTTQTTTEEPTTTTESTTATTEIPTTEKVTRKLRRLEIRRKQSKSEEDEKYSYTKTHNPTLKRIQKEFIVEEEIHSTTTKEPLDTREAEMEIERTANAIEKELIRAKAEVQAQQALKLEAEKRLMRTTEKTKKKKRRHRRKHRKSYHRRSELINGSPRVDGVKMAPQDDPKVGDDEKSPFVTKMEQDYPSAMDLIKKTETLNIAESAEKIPKREEMLSVLEQRLSNANSIKKKKSTPRKEFTMERKDRSSEKGSEEERMLIGDDLSREIERILHQVQKERKEEKDEEEKKEEQQVQVASVRESDEVVHKERKKKRRQQRIAQKKRLFSHELIAQPTSTTTTTKTTTTTTTTTTESLQTTTVENGLVSAELLTIQQISGIEPLQITRRHCRNIRSFAWQHGMADVTDFALLHCSYIENYYPNLPCARAEEYMVYCRQFYKQF
ncbi:unnamed protein product, partial [Mesorhabditis belari]|uniref:aECM cysteine-cradle domain-containing protein n=1 Tax=Mesorhabditis belari TaxID=2138241 RepID=A0AAF3FP97_9BILA